MSKRQPVTTSIQFFSSDELKCKGSGELLLDPFFADALPLLRIAWGDALSLNSACRSPSHNKSIGGHPNSFHLTVNKKWPTVGCMAADVRWRHWTTPMKLKFAKLAWSMDWSVGLHNAFCHIDRRADLHVKGLNKAVFLYGEWGSWFDVSDVKINSI